jgi:hypothetical protein
MAKKNFKRRKKLIDPALQLRLTGTFVALSALALLLQYLLFANVLAQAAAEMPDGGSLLAARTGRLLLETLATSALVVLPLIAAVGVLTTFKVAGPLYRFRVYLIQVRRGEDPGPCRIRKTDALQELAVLITETTEPLRSAAREREVQTETASHDSRLVA